MQLENLLFFRKKFKHDEDAHIRNLREIERWAASPLDLLSLIDKEVLPAVGEVTAGSIVRVGDDLYLFKTASRHQIQLGPAI